MVTKNNPDKAGFVVGLDWWRDAQGYVLEPAVREEVETPAPIKVGPGYFIPKSPPPKQYRWREARIVGKGGQLVS
ncbi:MAG: hypothetical protein IIB17_11300, partial [Chloroflexi bacterium]|nr:hypothetical protein [Chloroflexota bacterium]